MPFNTPSKLQKYRLEYPIYLVILILINPILSIQAAQDDRNLLSNILELSGIALQLELAPDTVEASVVNFLQDQAKEKKLSRDEIRYFVEKLRDSYAIEVMSKSVLTYLAEKLNPTQIDIILRWLNSGPGAHFVELEGRASQPDQIANLRRFTQQLNESPPTPERIELMRTLNAATLASKSTLVILMTSKLAIALTNRNIDAADKAVTTASIRKRISRQQLIVEEETTSMVIIGLLYTYRFVSTEDLRTYIKFAQSPVGITYHEVLLKAYYQAMLDASNKYERAISEYKGQ